MSRRLPLLGLLGAGLLVVGAATGCASGAASAPGSSSPGTTPDATAPVDAAQVEAAWLNGGTAIALVTWGSSSCAPRIDGQAAVVEGTLDVTVSDPSGTACTRDMAPRATFVSLPAGVDPTQSLDIAVRGAVKGTGTLAGLAAPEAPAEFTPSAGWVDDSLIAILTYGSSSCLPVVETVTTQGDTVAVGFATPPADQVCTLDMAPQLTLADVSGAEASDATSLTLSGGGVTVQGSVPILGTR